MKAVRKILAAVVCLSVVLSCAMMTSYAAGTGSITVQNQSGTNATVAGKDLNLFKIFSATTNAEGNVAYQWVKHTDGSDLFKSFFFGDAGILDNGVPKYNRIVPAEASTIEDVVVYLADLGNDSLAFSQMAANLHQYIHDYNETYPSKIIEPIVPTVRVPQDATSYTFLDLDLGYYLVYDATTIAVGDEAVRSAAMLAHPGENKVIYLKADRPHLEKFVYDAGSDVKWQLGTTASVGDTVKFKIKTAVPDHALYGNDYTFIISDVMADGLEYVDNSLEIKAYKPDGVTEENALTYDAPEFDTAEGEDIKIDFTNITSLAKGTVIEVVYEAKVLNTAEVTNVNTATLTYSNDPNNAGHIGDDSAAATVAVWKFVLSKHLEDTNGAPSYIRLPGAQFNIYEVNGGVETLLTFTEESITENGVTFTKYTLDPTGTGTSTIKTLDGGANVDDGKTDVGYDGGAHLGQAFFFGLSEGDYIIRETKAPDGYQLAKGDFAFTLTDTIGQTGAVANGEITYSRTIRPGQFTRVFVDEKNHVYYIGITNAPGQALPETGGMGTTLFTILGVILMAGALAFFTSRKRSSAV